MHGPFPDRLVALSLLARRCGPLDDALRERVAAPSAERLLALSVALLDFSGRDDLERWLAEGREQGI